MRPSTRVAAGVFLEFRAVPVLLWSFSGISLGTALGFADGDGSHGWFVAALGVGALLQGFVAHSINEVVDWRSGTDRHPAPRVLSGGSKVLVFGLLTERHLLALGLVSAAAAVGLGVATAAERGWWLLSFGALGLAGAALYTLPPLRAAYLPFAGEAVALLCVGACVLGGYAVQRGTLSGAAWLVAGAHGALCVAMLMLHHLLDREPDATARPRKLTSVVFLGAGARSYGVAWGLVATGLAAAATLGIDGAFAPLVVSGTVASLAHLRSATGSARSVTLAEATVIVVGIGAALGAATLAAPRLWWIWLVPLVLGPLELVVASRALRPVPERPTHGAPHGGPPSVGPQSPTPR